MWNADVGGERYTSCRRDLTTQAGLAVRSRISLLVSLLGLTHVERNGHHYVVAWPDCLHEQDGFLAAHPGLYEHSRGAVRLKIRQGRLAIGSLAGAGFASGADHDWAALKPIVSPPPRRTASA